jgi:adenylate cyclase class 2
MIEIEQKYRCPNADRLEARLADLGATFVKVESEADHYFNAPDRDYAVTGEAFRLRRVDDVNVLTYKGPKRADSSVKVRSEIELEVAVGQEGAERTFALLAGLGYRAVAIVRKERRSFSLTHNGFAITICLDDCHTVGRFVELEILADESTREPAVVAIQSLAADLGLTDPEARSYLRMVLEKQASS